MVFLTRDGAGKVATEFDVGSSSGTANPAETSVNFHNFLLAAVFDPATSIKAIAANQFSVSPNPATVVVSVSLKNNGEVITFISAEGKVIETRVLLTMLMNLSMWIV